MKIKTELFITEYNQFNGSTVDFHKHLQNTYSSDVTLNSVYTRIKRLTAKGKLSLESGNKVATGELLKGTSTLYGEDGEIKLQWVKTDTDKESIIDAFRDVIDDIVAGVEPVDPIPQPLSTTLESELTTFYPLPDLHFGLLINADESSHKYNWDMNIASRWVAGAMDHLVESSPFSKYAVITDLGDYLHAEDNQARTNSGHQLDTDGRHSKIVKLSFDVTRRLIDQALKKHEIVYFYSVAGNHSENSSIYLKAFLSAWYRNEPRVNIIDKHVAQQYHIFGKNILGFSHGHELKPAKAAEVLVADNQSNFSDSEFRYFHFGHFHSNQLAEGNLCTIEIHKNIIPHDKWADSMGYRGTIGEAKAIYYHHDYGEVGRTRFSIKMLPNVEKLATT